MDFATFSGHIHAIVSEFLENSGCPNMCAELLREIADDVFEEEDDDGPDPGVLWNDTSAELT